MSTKTTELVTLKIAATPAIPGPADVAAAWLESLTSRTRRAYGKDLDDFGRFLRLASGSAAAELLWGMENGQANAIALGYRTDMARRKLAASTIRRRLSALRSIVTFARTVGRIVWALDVRSPKVTAYRDTAGPGEDGWLAIVADAKVEATKRTDKALRDLAIVLLMGDRGIRRGELVALDHPADFDQARPAIAILGKGKTEKEWHTINERTRAALVDWLQARGAQAGPLFTRLDRAARGPARLTDWGVWHIARRIGRRVGLAKDLRPHGLRHRAITKALEITNGDIPSAMKFSRHADPRTVMIYDDRRTDVAGEITRSLGGE